MNFYTLTYDANKPAAQQVNVPTNTDYKIGVKVVRNGEQLDLGPADVTLGALSADAELTNGYLTFTRAAGDEPNMELSELYAHYEPTTALSSQSFSARGHRPKQATVAILGSEVIGNYPVSVKATDLKVKAWKSSSSIVTDLMTAWDTSGRSWYLHKDINKWIMYGTTDVASEEIEIDPTKNMSVSWGSTIGTFEMYIEITYGMPAINQKFKLVENVFKSQQGDLADISFDNTVNIAGTLSDDTEFSYNALMK